MASQNAPRAPRRPSAPRPGSSGSGKGKSKGRKDTKPSVPALPSAGASPAESADAVAGKWHEAGYGYVKRDMTRIFVISALMFALIYASTFFLAG